MTKINEIKEQKIVVESVGGFAGSLQQIAAGRMVVLRKIVLASRRFVDETTLILRELKLEQIKLREQQLRQAKVIKKKPKLTEPETKPTKNQAIIVITSDQGLCGVYNIEIFKKVDQIVNQYPEAEYFVIGTKGQAYFRKLNRKRQLKFYPYNIPEQANIEDLRPLITMFNHYQKINLIYSKYINTVTREVVFIDLAIPNIEIKKDEKKDQPAGKFIFEPSIDDLIKNLSFKLRYALFRQQILDSKLSLYTAQMIAMQTASENADELLIDLQKEYNKQRRKLVDKKIQEVQAGRSLWGEEGAKEETDQTTNYIPLYSN